MKLTFSQKVLLETLINEEIEYQTCQRDEDTGAFEPEKLEVLIELIGNIQLEKPLDD